ncbi:MAG: FAD-binding oxidoreductase, partial [Candidatus Competibacteraceae bacterium]|nr:FAD-binding oxidoreductase [Candidatus Competibacteraceae bacterium]
IGPVPEHTNAFVIGSVHSGYTSGPYMGKLLAQYILGQEPELPLFDPQRLLTSINLDVNPLTAENSKVTPA